ncbi:MULTISPECIES: hypothetical protein [Burkholderiaceae]|uniref:hypothetical protein n=1 Tax=Burkholderiaceae TaxID=119060 RepID=UPI00095979DF|nr:MULTISPECIES: hypothetical protein [Burkholderiaceae]MCG1041030.1 hypothetical protein [Mycetohabitans sp. B7]SIT64839.1 hypothetical protein SAMN04487769_0036 [Burkholderia sp. b14]
MNSAQSASALPLQVQSVALPKGGGAITGLREVAKTDMYTGSLQFSLPLRDSASLPPGPSRFANNVKKNLKVHQRVKGANNA